MSPITLKLIANSGVFLTYEHQTFLLDAIYGKNRFFSPPQKEIQKAVFGMESCYRHVSYLLSSHRHIDHFSAAYTDAYTTNNKVERIFVPQPTRSSNSALEDQGLLPNASGKNLLEEISLKMGECICYDLDGGCSVSYLRCHHLDEQSYSLIIHCAVLVSLGNCRLLFCADADFSEENAVLFQTLRPLTAIFVTPLFFAHPAGRHLLESLHPEQAVLYHLPFEPDDSTGLRPMAVRLLKEHGEASPYSLLALTDPGQILKF